MTASLVTPGSIIAKEGEHEHGEGTTLADGNIVSTVVGYVHVDNGSISVSASKPIVAPVVGDTVLCEVVKLNEKNGEAMILAIEGKPGSIQPQHLYGQFFVPDWLTASCTKPPTPCADETCAVPSSRKSNPWFASTSEARLRRAPRHLPLRRTRGRTRRRLERQVSNCGYQSYRALADNFGAGWAELDQAPAPSTTLASAGAPLPKPCLPRGLPVVPRSSQPTSVKTVGSAPTSASRATAAVVAAVAVSERRPAPVSSSAVCLAKSAPTNSATCSNPTAT